MLFINNTRTAAAKFQYHKDNAMYKRPEHGDEAFRSPNTALNGEAPTFPWPPENTISTLLVNNPKKPLLFLVNLLFMATGLQLNAKAQKNCWCHAHQGISQDPVMPQCFPHLSRAIIPVTVQNANIPMIISASFLQ